MTIQLWAADKGSMSYGWANRWQLREPHQKHAYTQCARLSNALLLHSAGNLRKAWQQLKDWGDSEKGRDQIRRAMQLCPAANLTNRDAVDELALWAQNAFDYLVRSACFAQTLSLTALLPLITAHQQQALHCDVPSSAAISSVLTLLGLERLHAYP